MEIYTKSDLDILDNNINQIEDQVKKRRLELFEPNNKQVKKIINIIETFLRKTKRKVYGGHALNKIVAHRNKDDCLYSQYDLPDIDFYSPSPLDDFFELCNQFHEAGFKTSGSEAQHEGTYSIFVMYVNFVDITYVPTNIYHRIPFEEKGGIRYTGIRWMMIDFFRQFADPLNSYFRLQKAFKRFPLLQKYAPIKKNPQQIQIDFPDSVKPVLTTFEKEVITKDGVIMVGLSAYQKMAEFTKTSTKHLKLGLDQLPYYELMLPEYENTGKKIINIIQKAHPDLANKVTVVEYTPYFQFLGDNAIIYVNQVPVARIFSNNGQCIPVHRIKRDGGEIKLGSYSIQMLYSMSMMMKGRTDKKKDMTNVYSMLVSHLIELKREYFKRSKKDIMDETPFAEFIVDCIGTTVPPEIAKQLRIEENKRKNKPYRFTYRPADKLMEPGKISFRYPNTSGNPIKNVKYMVFQKELALAN